MFQWNGVIVKVLIFFKIKKKIESRKIIIICSLECNWFYYVIFKGIYLYMNFKICQLNGLVIFIVGNVELIMMYGWKLMLK